MLRNQAVKNWCACVFGSSWLARVPAVFQSDSSYKLTSPASCSLLFSFPQFNNSCFFLGHVPLGQSFFSLIFAFYLHCKMENRLAKHFAKTCSWLKNGVYRRTAGIRSVVFQRRTWLQQETGLTGFQASGSLFLSFCIIKHIVEHYVTLRGYVT